MRLGNPRNDAEDGQVEFLRHLMIVAQAGVRPVYDHHRDASDDQRRQAQKGAVFDAFRHPLMGIEQPAVDVVEQPEFHFYRRVGLQPVGDICRKGAVDTVQEMGGELFVVEDGDGRRDLAGVFEEAVRDGFVEKPEKFPFFLAALFDVRRFGEIFSSVPSESRWRGGY